MNIIEINRRFSTKEKCIEHLEKLRWNGSPVCPYCGMQNNIKIKSELRHHCYNCTRSFSVLVGTIFEDSRLSLHKYFTLIGLMLNAKQGISSNEISRHIGVNNKTTWYACMRVRCGMVESVENMIGRIEMDETYVGGSPRKPNKKHADNQPSISSLSSTPNKRGRGTAKIGITGIVERSGKKRITVKVMEAFRGNVMLAMLKKHIKEENATVITDAATHYKIFDKEVRHKIIKHAEQMVKGELHTNTIDGFWRQIKTGIDGSYRAISEKYLPFYLTEFTYKYNRRNRRQDQFNEYLRNALSDTNCMVNYQPKKDAKEIVYKTKKQKHGKRKK